jgi:hypothetical protein
LGVIEVKPSQLLLHPATTHSNSNPSHSHLSYYFIILLKALLFPVIQNDSDTAEHNPKFTYK